MLNISIPKPCHEDWDQMSPNQQGRHCSSCMKTVVDFTGMSDDEVKNFFISKKEEKLCGRFSTTQLQTIRIDLPQNVFDLSMPMWKQFLLACLIAFSAMLFSCEVNQQGNPETENIVSVPALKASGASYKNVLETDPRNDVRVGMFDMKWDSSYIILPDGSTLYNPDTADTIAYNRTMGVPIFESSMLDSAMSLMKEQEKTDTVPFVKPGRPLMGDTIFIPVKDPIRIKKGEVKCIPDSIPTKTDPPKADSTKCGDFT